MESIYCHCGELRAGTQRYCKECHAKSMRVWRKKHPRVTTAQLNRLEREICANLADEIEQNYIGSECRGVVDDIVEFIRAVLIVEHNEKLL